MMKFAAVLAAVAFLAGAGCSREQRPPALPKNPNTFPAENPAPDKPPMPKTPANPY
jgi:hypothetical protein